MKVVGKILFCLFVIIKYVILTVTNVTIATLDCSSATHGVDILHFKITNEKYYYLTFKICNKVVQQIC